MRAITMSRIVAAVAILALAGACSDPTGSSSDPTSDAPGTLSLVPGNATIQPGYVLVLRVRMIDRFGISQGAAIRWMSSNPAVATVSAAGAVTGLAEGQVQITASVGRESRVSTVRVLPAAPKPELRPVRPNLEPWRRQG